MNKKQCKYCIGRDCDRKPLFKNNNGSYFVIINSCNYLEDSVIGNSTSYSLFGEEISFCPKCGRKLSK